MGVEDSKEGWTASEAQTQSGKEPEGVAVTTGYSSSGSLGEQDRPRRVKEGAAFETTEDVRFYKPIPTYEGFHRWDPDFEWEEHEEKKIVRKIDLRVATFACVTFFALQLDRGNIVQALSGNLLDELHMNTNDYNTGQTIFYICFLFAELPSQLISKKLGPDRWIPIQMLCWSLVASMQAFLSGRSSFFACRALLGIFEGGL